LTTHTFKLLKELDAKGDYDSPTYKEIEKVLGSQFTTRQVPSPNCWHDCFKAINTEIYVTIQGPSEFTIKGVLEHWNVTPKLGSVNVPAIVIRGEYDTMSERCCMAIVDAIPKCEPLVTIPKAAHCKLLDEPNAVCDVIVQFVDKAENKAGQDGPK